VYIRLQDKTHILDVSDTFAYLQQVLDNGDLQFEFMYSISQRQAIDKKATRVRVTVISRNIVAKSLLGDTQRGIVDTVGLVSNIRTAVIDAYTALAARQNYELATRHSDVTAFVNNDAVSQLRAQVPTSQIQSLNRPRLTLQPVSSVKEGSDPQPILHRTTNTYAVPDFQQQLTSSLGEDPRSLMHAMITRQGLDPSHIFNLAHRSQSEHASHGGLSNPQRAIERTTDPAARLLNFFLFPPVINVPPTSTDQISDTDMVNVLRTVSSDVIDVPVTVVIPNSKLMLESAPLTQVFVKFDLLDAESNLPIDTVNKVLDLSKHLQIYYTPRQPPKVTPAASEISSRVNLEIKQIDRGATEVQVFKKSIWIASAETDDYSLIGTYPLTSQDQTLLVQVDKPTYSSAVYRVISRGKQSMQSFEYTNVVIRSARYTPDRAVALSAIPVDTGIQIEVRHLPTNVVAVQFLRLNLTTFDSAPATVGNDVGLITDDVRQADLVTIIDNNVFANNTYRYTVRLIYLDGNTEEFGDATIDFIQPAPGAVDTKIEQLTVDNDVNPNVTFTITTSTVDTNIDVVKRLLEQLGIDAHFSDDITKQRDELKQLIAHAVHRVDLNTGKREYFGIVTVPDFDDAALRKNQAISPLEYGHRYRYEVYPLLRSAETMFDSFVKTSTDPTTKKTYTWSPAKFLHPLALTAGVLVSPTGARQRYAKDPMAFGAVGSVTTIEVSFDQDAVKVIDPVATVFDRQTNVVSWKILGNIAQADSFVVFKEVHGIRTLLGKTHSEFANGNCQFIHTVNHHDVGSLRYVIVPITGDYLVGAAAITNTVVVEGSS
jgi:hypothetical protein